MKKSLLIFIFIFLAFIVGDKKIKAEQGTCIIQQLSNTYEVELPFYWYTATKETTVNNLMQQTIEYNHTTTLIDNSSKCNNLTGLTPKKENASSNTLNSKITNYNFSNNELSNSESIYKESLNKFKYSPASQDLKIKASFISLDNLPPLITTDNLNPIIITSLEECISVTYLQLKLTAFDEVDGKVNIKVHQDNYTNNYNVLGDHTIIFSASDKSNNTSYLTITIKVEDRTKPIIEGNQNIKSNMSNPLTVKQIKDTLIAKDNYYSLDSSSISIHKDNYTGNEQKEGTFTVSFKATDPSNNTSNEFIVYVTTYDNIPPSLNGEQNYEISNKILLDINEIANNLIATDNIDKNPTIKLVDDSYTLNYFKIGLYQITFIATDKNENESSPHVININVKDVTKPTIYISQKFIGVDGRASIDIKDIIEIIEQTNNISLNNLIEKRTIKDEYSQNKNIPGEYIIELNYTYESGENINIETKIIVGDFTQKEIIEETKSTPRHDFWSAIKNFLSKLWNFIKYIFSFKWLKN